ncbi:TMEM175 family protein [Dokdonella sp.]|uniref:TMEM175 family protein n=1 Tax=Dokdonella sp. TaxID=2291710 RepID=UPI0031C775B6|nr:TMEM175 family protein [Dokdonella sp.]
MDKGRLEAFSDGVLAVIITIMVLEMKPPHAVTIEALRGLWPVFLSYVLSFVYVGIYWNNHHHLLKAVERIDGRVMWANLLVLFFISLFPFTTAWMSENSFAPVPTALYGLVLLLAALAWPVLLRTLIACNGPQCPLARATRRDAKGWSSIVLYLLAIPLALFVNVWTAGLLYAAVAALWFVPDRRLEKIIAP